MVLFTQAQTLTLSFRAKNMYKMYSIYRLFLHREVSFFFPSAEEFLWCAWICIQFTKLQRVACCAVFVSCMRTCFICKCCSCAPMVMIVLYFTLAPYFTLVLLFLCTQLLYSVAYTSSVHMFYVTSWFPPLLVAHQHMSFVCPDGYPCGIAGMRRCSGCRSVCQ